MPPRPERYERVGIDVHAAPERGRLMGALVGLGVGVGLLLVWSAFACRAAPRRERPTAGRRTATCSTGPGSARSSVDRRSWSLCARLRRRRRSS